MALLGLSELQLSFFASAHLCRVDFAGSKWLLVTCHCWSSRRDLENLPDTQGLRRWGDGGSQQGRWASLESLHHGSQEGNIYFFFFFFPQSVAPQKCSKYDGKTPEAVWITGCFLGTLDIVFNILIRVINLFIWL